MYFFSLLRWKVECHGRHKLGTLTLVQVHRWARATEWTTISRKRKANISSGTLHIVCNRHNNNTHTMWSVSFIGYFLDWLAGLTLSKRTVNSTLHRLFGHVHASCFLYCQTQCWIRVRISVLAFFYGRANHAPYLKKSLRTTLILRALAILNVIPFIVTGHASMLLVFKLQKGTSPLCPLGKSMISFGDSVIALGNRNRKCTIPTNYE